MWIVNQQNAIEKFQAANLICKNFVMQHMFFDLKFHLPKQLCRYLQRTCRNHDVMRASHGAIHGAPYVLDLFHMIYIMQKDLSYRKSKHWNNNPRFLGGGL